MSAVCEVHQNSSRKDLTLQRRLL